MSNVVNSKDKASVDSKSETNEFLMSRLVEMKCDEEAHNDDAGDIYVTLETAKKFALDEGGERGKAVYEFLCKEQEKTGKACNKLEEKKWMASLEARARRAAKRVGLKAIKSTDRSSKALGKKDRFKLIDPRRGWVVAGEDYDLSAADLIGICKNLTEYVGVTNSEPRTLKETADELGLIYEGLVIWMYKEGYFDESGQLTQHAIDSGYFASGAVH